MAVMYEKSLIVEALITKIKVNSYVSLFSSAQETNKNWPVKFKVIIVVFFLNANEVMCKVLLKWKVTTLGNYEIRNESKSVKQSTKEMRKELWNS